MGFELLNLGASPYFAAFPEGRIWGFLLLAAYVGASLVILVASYRDWLRFLKHPLRLILLAGLLLLAPLCQILLIRFQGSVLLSPPGVPLEPRGVSLALLGAIPLVLAAGYLGVGPALVVGFVSGLMRGLFDTYSVFTPFETALLAALAAACLHQPYRGTPARWLRHPIVAAPVAAGAIWLLTFLGLWGYSPAGGLSGWDYVTVLWAAVAPALIAEAALGGLFGEVALAATPRAWPPREGTRPPPYAHSLNRQLLFTLVPLTLLGIGVLFWADTSIAVRVATGVVLDQMSRDAQNAAKGIPFFVQTGRGLIHDLAGDDRLLDADPAVRQARLEQGLRAIPYFRQLTLFDTDLQPIAGYPESAPDILALTLSPDERQFVALALEGVPQQTTVYPDNPDDPILISFVSPVGPPGEVRGVLLGRADLVSNPLMEPVTNSLQGLLVGSGQGFIVDERGNIIYHPDKSQLMLPWQPEPSARRLTLLNPVPSAMAYEDRAADGTRRLVFYLPVGGHPWSVVVMVPYQVVLSLATQISVQILVMVVLIGAAAIVLVSLLARRLTRPLETLARAAERIGQDELDRPIAIAGEDEVGRLGLTFEAMRARLKDRLEELSLLLAITHRVAENLNLEASLPPILDAAIAATGAGGARLVIEPEAASAAPEVFSCGEAADDMAPLDGDVLAITEKDGPFTIENVTRARAVLDVAAVAGRVQAAAAFPLRHESRYQGALWLGYDKPHTFSKSELDFLTTLAGQAALAIANHRLYEAAEGGRRQLAAILASTPDAVVVTDRQGRIALMNPAAEAVFGLTGHNVDGRPAIEVVNRPGLVDILRADADAPDSHEVLLPDGRTLYASASTVGGEAGSALGRVAVLRDVTHFKQLEQLKTEFVATVSHDLRAPLTFMRGYATMLPMIGGLNVKQKDFVDKILVGIEQMTKLIDDLLDLGRIEAGVGLVREMCRIETLVEGAAETLRGQAVNKGQSIKVDMPATLPEISGDPTLLRQVVANLVENAIKYTPQGGAIHITAETRDGSLVLAVSDTGVGIAQADQVRLFEKFYRVRQRDTANIKGTGLGLSIVKSVVEWHGGRVWVESRLGRGSTFYVSLPI